MVAKGDRVVVVAGVKVKKGTTGKVFWTGETKFGLRVGFTDDAGGTLWTAMGNVEKVAPVAPVAAPVVDEPTPGAGPSLEAKVDALLVLAEVLAKNVLALEAKVAALMVAADAPAVELPVAA